ncbi:MAG TPA: SurA N-terminal domain-containing protein [Croceibacterium sp.]|nr:SurA N-terminal domain-containing protein [Croceibacterium sp.]
MLLSFRSFFKSKVGIAVTLAFLALIAFAFASMDVAGSATFGGVSGGDRVAVVGKERVDAAELTSAMSNALDSARQTNPTLTMQAFVEQGGMEQVMSQLLERTALAEYARQHGMRAGKRLVDSEIAQIPAFRGIDGKFDRNTFLALLGQRGLSEATVRQDLSTGLLARQLLTPISFSPVMPESVGRRYASLLRERRHGAIAMLSSDAFAPKGDPSDAQLQAYYREVSSRFIRPERRVIRYASFGPEALGTVAAPTDAQIAEYYNANKAQYAASESRRFTQLVVPTQDAANAILAEVRGGKSLDVAAREKGLATTSVGPVAQTNFANSASAAVAQSGFAAAQGALAQPARGSLGWYVLRVDAIDRQPARTLEQARAEISTKLAEDQRRDALADLTARIEDEFSGGTNLSELAKELNLQISTTRPATADGRIYGAAGETVDPALAPVLETAFVMDEGQPQLAEVVPGQSFMVFDVSNITSSAVAPLAEIRGDVVEAWRQAEGAKAAKQAADRILARVAKGTALAAAVSAESNAAVRAPETVNLNREELSRLGQVPSSLALFFSMAQGTQKKLQAPADAGWYVIQLDKIEAGTVAQGDPLVASTLMQLGQVTGEEYVQQFIAAAQREVGVERNETAIRAVSAQLAGTTDRD